MEREEVRLATELASQNINPAEYFYRQAIESGYTPEEKKAASKPSTPKKSLNDIRDIKNRSKSTVVGGANSFDADYVKLPFSLFDQMGVSKDKLDKAF